MAAQLEGEQNITGCCSVPDLTHAAGAFVGPDGKGLPVPEGLPNAHMRLFGGAQYHRCAQFLCSMTS